MARKQYRPGRILIAFLVGTGILYGLVALAGSWKPELGLDLQGGTRITLVAKGNPSGDSLAEARSIIDQRVNGSGVTEAEVMTQGGDIIVVEIPGRTRRDLVETVERQAQLRFRLVACSEGSGQPCTPGSGAAPSPDGQLEIPGTDDAVITPQPDATSPAGQGDGQGSGQGNGASDGADNGTNNRVAPSYAAPSDGPSGTPSPTPSGGTGTPDATPTDSATDAPQGDTVDESAVAPLAKELAWVRGGFTQADVELYNSYTCGEDGTLLNAADGTPATLADNPLKALVACSPPEAAQGRNPAVPSLKYLLSKSIIAGTDLDSADYGIPQNEVSYVVTLNIGGEGRKVFAQASTDLVANEEQFAIVLDGSVISAPTFTSRIPDGNAQITGNFSESSAKSLATSLKFGALPISFDEPSTETIGPSLAGDQLTAGLTAGGFGLVLVLIYCLLYYRGLGTVVVASLLAAGAVNYALVLLLSETAGFTLTLPGIAGLIIAIGVTADSFIIFFERIRDEMREGKSMRVAVETGWKRAKVTRLAAQVVSLLSAAVLYIFATGAVKGFGFALGLTTIVDLAILFWFTKPMVSWLARFKFFNSGHRLSGLSPSTLGIDGPVASTVGGKA
ncbi:protein translocase subunit SecD [Nocardioides sp. R-C-SC26]|uniref:protein translocase subunit SecD n=1 Tax=Nocardioides sp. R-C-SC26 TaxID=2870414 RepID=UPI001E3781A6|nr:protein translocase subunit SecD [Nocardioides sp. R-C-SC26]